MTVQTAIINTQNYGAALSSPTLRQRMTDTAIASAGSANAITAGSGRYALVFTEAAVHAAGWYSLRAFAGGAPINRFVYFTGVDGETAFSVVDMPTAGDAAVTGPVERSVTDTKPITFEWPVSGATITVTRSIDNASYVAAIGVAAFLRTRLGKHYYTLSYNVADRPTTEGQVVYGLTDGEYTLDLVLRVSKSGDGGAETALAILCLDWTTITGEVPSRSALNALRHIRNKWALDGDTKTVYAEDDTTPAFTSTVTADGAGNITADTPD
jgi:hypothetical protein